MITTVAITPEAISDPSGGHLDGARDHLLRLLEMHCVLVFTEPEDYQRCRDAVQRMPDNLEKSRWNEFLSRIEGRFISRPPKPLADLDSLRDVKGWEGKGTRLLLVTPGHFSRITGGKSASRCLVEPTSGVEIAHAELVHLTQSIGPLHRRTNITFRSPDFPDGPPTRNALWDDWIRPLVRSHTRVTILDTHLGKALVRQAAPGGLGFKHAKTGELFELPWLLGKVASAAPMLRDEHGSEVEPLIDVTILTGIPDGGSASSIAEALGSLVTFLSSDENVPIFGHDRRIRSLTLRTFPVKNKEHARHIRFTNSVSGRPSYHRYLRFEAGIDALRYEDLSKWQGSGPRGDWDLTYRVGPQPSMNRDGEPLSEAALMKASTPTEIRLDLEALLSLNTTPNPK